MKSIKNGAENFQIDQCLKFFLKTNYLEKLYYLTFLNFGVLKKIIFKLKNNIETIRAGTKKSIKSELTKEGVLAKIRCM